MKKYYITEKMHYGNFACGCGATQKRRKKIFVYTIYKNNSLGQGNNPNLAVYLQINKLINDCPNNYDSIKTVDSTSNKAAYFKVPGNFNTLV